MMQTHLNGRMLFVQRNAATFLCLSTVASWLFYLVICYPGYNLSPDSSLSLKNICWGVAKKIF